MTDAENVPADLSGAQAPTATLFRPSQVAAATFFGHTGAGTVLIGLNFWKSGRKTAACMSLALALIATVGVVAFYMLANKYWFMFYGLEIIGMALLSRHLQSIEFEQHFAKGGKRASTWAAVGIGIAWGAVVWLCAQVGFALIDSTETPSIKVSAKEQVFYGGDATEQDAKRLGNALKKAGFFNGEPAAVAIEITDKQINVLFPVSGAVLDSKSQIEVFRNIGRQIAPDIGGPPIHIKLTDDDWTALKDIQID